MSRFALCLLALPLFPQVPGSPNPAISRMVDAVSVERIEASMRKLEAFETRGNFSEADHPTRGIGAARRWILSEFKSYSPRLEVRFDSYNVRKQGRIFRDVEIVNVVATLPGTLHPERQIIVSGHYDSLNLGQRSSRAGGPQISNPDEINAAVEKLAQSPAPGVSDDASGVASVLELARVLSQYEFEKTLVFIAFAGEEIGLVGSTLHAQKAKREKQIIEAVLNSDIIGTELSGDGRRQNRSVRVFSAGPEDSPSRQLARYVKAVGERYHPAMEAALVFRADRFNRGGDHTPFEREGYAAVRLTSAVENYEHQHSPTDTLANASPAYAVQVTRLKAGVLASLALAPKTPQISVTTGEGTSRRTLYALTRGTSAYDATMSWAHEAPEPDLAGFSVLTRASTAALWERETFVGKRHDHQFPGVDIDGYVFAVQAVDEAGNASLPAAWVMPDRPLLKLEVIPQEEARTGPAGPPAMEGPRGVSSPPGSVVRASSLKM